MNFFARLWKWAGGNSTTQRRGSQQNTPSSTVHDDAPLIGIDGALQISTVWACVTLLVEIISSLPLFTYQTDKTGARSKASKKLRIYNVLHRSPNKRQTAQEFWEQMLLNFFLRGNMYARMVKDSKGEVIALWPMASDQIEVFQTPDDEIFYKYYVNNQIFVYAEIDVLHIRGMGSGHIGLSPLDYMRSSLGLAVNAQNHTSKIYRKSSRRAGVLMSDVVLNDEQRAALKKNMGDIVNGTDHELYILEAQFKFEPLGMTPADIELLSTRKFAVQDLARWFGVPSVLINDTGESTALGSSVAQIIEAFFKLKLRPQLSRIEAAIYKRVLSPSQRANGITVEFSFDALLRATMKDRMEIYSKAAQNGIKTRNEIRRLENDPPIEGGDVLTVQSNLIPIDMLGKVVPSQKTNAVPEEPIRQQVGEL